MSPMDENPPQDVEMEAAILGAMMFDAFAVEKAQEVGLTEAMFVRPDHRLIFSACMDIVNQGTAVPDVMVVSQHLDKLGQLRSVGGRPALASLAESRLPVANSRAYAKAVRDTAILRSLVRRGHQIAELGYAGAGEPEELISKAGEIIDAMSIRATLMADAGLTTLGDELLPFVESTEERVKRGARMPGLSTGLAALDTRWGGLQDGKLYVVAGRPGMGKSALGSGIFESVAFGSDADVMIVNLEMREAEQAGRALARLGGFPLARWTMGSPTDDEIENASQYAQQVHRAAKRLHMDRSSDLTVAQIRQRARRLDRDLQARGRRLRGLLVDYMQLITPPAGMRADNENAVISHNSRNLKALAGELAIPVMVLSQLNRAVEARPDKKPMLSDLRGSGSIEQDADVVALLWRPEYYLKDNTPTEWVGTAYLDTAKFRGGTPGVDQLGWEGEFVRFTDERPVPVFHVGGAAA